MLRSPVWVGCQTLFEIAASEANPDFSGLTNSDGSLVVIEAKGGSSQLGHGYGHPQGSPSWAVEAAQRIAKSPAATAIERLPAPMLRCWDRAELLQQGQHIKVEP